MNNKILKDWFWPWQIFFDKEVKQRVLDFASNLKSNEKNFYEQLIKFYSQYYTLQMLIDYTTDNPKNALHAINYAFENTDKILNIPEQMKGDFIVIIKLVLYMNNQHSNLDILYTLFHEVYLGHGNFFSIIKRNSNYIDIGATLIIEGFATFCELSVGYNKDYEQYYLNKYYNFLNCAFTNKIEKLDCYEKAKIINYPLFKENYYIGAIILMNKIKNQKNLKDFYKMITNENLTDLLINKLT